MKDFIALLITSIALTIALIMSFIYCPFVILCMIVSVSVGWALSYWEI